MSAHNCLSESATHKYRVYDEIQGGWGDEPLRYIGARVFRERNLLEIVNALVRNGTKSEVYKAINDFDEREGIYRKAALIVNSYEQARLIKKPINDYHPEVGRGTKAIVRALKNGERSTDFVRQRPSTR